MERLGGRETRRQPQPRRRISASVIGHSAAQCASLIAPYVSDANGGFLSKSAVIGTEKRRAPKVGSGPLSFKDHDPRAAGSTRPRKSAALKIGRQLVEQVVDTDLDRIHVELAGIDEKARERISFGVQPVMQVFNLGAPI